ncbi:5557_t:CDS:2 [Funneliformis caledonium]|uniref:5557_t:CDS:1 n=1 Tax=Funneliformis caledonium TaxID=1117310 RepID=A0A9N8ZWP8_9GLOM|nr:5557_t:CDS:2 [Funneliformis caledonium]
MVKKIYTNSNKTIKKSSVEEDNDKDSLKEHELNLREREAKIHEMESLITKKEHDLKSTK